MADTFMVLSQLLLYPGEQLRQAAPALRAALAAEGLLPPPQRRAVNALIEELVVRNSYELQERYVVLFDRTRSLSLHLFEHIHGENRDRGQAMVDLRQHYEQHGLVISASELPDFLPLFLEFLSTRSVDEACALLGETLPVLKVLAERHHKRNSAYGGIFDALVTLAKGEGDPTAVQTLLDEPDDDPDDLEALDKNWEEAAVTFGPGAGGVAPDGACPAARDVLARMDPGPARRGSR